MQKTLKLKTLLIIVLSVVLSAMVFVGGMLMIKPASANDVKEAGIAFYDENVYERDKVRPYWKGNIMYNEVVLPIVRSDGSGTYGMLLYSPLQVLKVQNYDRTITYTEGVDYLINDRQIIIPAGSSIHAIQEGLTGLVNSVSEVQTLLDQSYGAGVFTANGQMNVSGNNASFTWGAVYAEGPVFHGSYLSVTYQYNPSVMSEVGETGKLPSYVTSWSNGNRTWNDVVSHFDSSYYTKLRTKLEAGQDINMLIMGDSITAESSSTHALGIAPYQRGYAILVAKEIERVYGVNVNITTIAVGGSRSNFLIEDERGIPLLNNALASVSHYDYAILAYGMNDVSLQGVGYKDAIQATVDKLFAHSSDCALTFVNTYPMNPDMGYVLSLGTVYDTFNTALTELTTAYNTARGDKEVRVVNMYDIGMKMMAAGKKYAEISNSNCNHPNDWFHRVYAMNIVNTLYNYDTVYDYDLRLSGVGTLFNFAQDANGWGTTGMDYGDGSKAYLTSQWYDSRHNDDTYSNGFTHRFGVYESGYNNGASRFSFVWQGYNVNYKSYDVTKPIEFKYAVSPVIAGDPYYGSSSVYSISLHKSLDDAHSAPLVNIDANWKNPGIISLLGTSSDVLDQLNIEPGLYGKLRVNEDASQVSHYFFASDRNATNWEKRLNLVTINVGETNTTIAVDGVQFATINVKRSDFPGGVAYMRATSNSNTIFVFAPASYEVKDDLYKYASNGTYVGDLYQYPQDTNGWSAYVQNSAESSPTYRDAAGNVVIPGRYGRNTVAYYNDYSNLKLTYGGFVANYNKINVNNPIRLTYLIDPSVQGDYTFALFDSLGTLFSAGNSTWNGSACGAKIWMRGANVTGLEQHIYENGVIVAKNLYNRVLFNAELYHNENVFATNYTADRYTAKPIYVYIDIQDEFTEIYVDYKYAGRLNIKRSDFPNRTAYMSLATAATGNIGAFVKAIDNSSVREDPTVQKLDGRFDANGYFVSTRGEYYGSNTGVVSSNTVETDTATKKTTFTTHIANVFNRNALDVTKEMVFTLNMSNVESGVGDSFYVMLFDNLYDLVDAGFYGFDGSKSNYKTYFRGSTAPSAAEYNMISGSFGKLTANYMGEGNTAVIRIYIGETVEENYVIINGVTVATGSQYNITRSAFKSGKVYASLIGCFAQQQWTVSMQNTDKSAITGTSVTINDGINMKTSFTLDIFHSSPVATIEYNGNTSEFTEFSMVNGKYYVNFDGVTPQFMNKAVNITVTALNEQGQSVEVGSRSYSVKDYALAILNGNYSEADKRLAVDLLNYGAAAQDYVHSDEERVNATLTDEQKALATQFDANVQSVMDRTNSNDAIWTGASLVLKDKVTLRYELKINPATVSDVTTVKVVFNKNGVISEVALSPENVTNKGYYIVEYANISATEFDASIEATVYINGVKNTATCTYSVNSWIKAKYSTPSEEGIAKALYSYGVSAKAYAQGV